MNVANHIHRYHKNFGKNWHKRHTCTIIINVTCYTCQVPWKLVNIFDRLSKNILFISKNIVLQCTGKKKMFNISEKKLIKDKPLDPYKHVHIHSLKCKFKNREPLIWNLSGKITGNTTVFQNADWTLFSWALWQC